MNIYHLIRNSHLWGLMENGPWTFCGNKSSDAYVLNFKWWHLHITYTIFPYTIHHLSITYALNAMWIVAMPYGVKNNSKESLHMFNSDLIDFLILSYSWSGKPEDTQGLSLQTDSCVFARVWCLVALKWKPHENRLIIFFTSKTYRAHTRVQ